MNMDLLTLILVKFGSILWVPAVFFGDGVDNLLKIILIIKEFNNSCSGSDTISSYVFFDLL